MNPDSPRKTFTTGKPAIGDLLIGAVSGKPFVSVEVPVFRGKEIKDLLGVAIFPQRLNDILKSQQLPPNWLAAVVDSSGTIVARTHSPERFIGEKAKPEALQALSQSHNGAVDVVTVEGIPAIAAFSQSDISHWAVLIGIPVAGCPRYRTPTC